MTALAAVLQRGDPLGAPHAAAVLVAARGEPEAAPEIDDVLNVSARRL